MGELDGPSNSCPVSLTTAALRVKVYISWGSRSVMLTDVSLNGTSTILVLDCLRLLSVESNTMWYWKKPRASSSDTGIHEIKTEVPSEDLWTCTLLGDTKGAIEV